MKKTILTTALILGTSILATSGIKLMNQKTADKTAISMPINNNVHDGKEIASAD